MIEKVIDPIELPDEDGMVSFFLTYNGEPAFVVEIENLPRDHDAEDDKKVDVATLKVGTMPLLGGKGEEATVTLKAQGS